jgi:hypothetical protein
MNHAAFVDEFPVGKEAVIYNYVSDHQSELDLGAYYYNVFKMPSGEWVVVANHENFGQLDVMNPKESRIFMGFSGELTEYETRKDPNNAFQTRFSDLNFIYRINSPVKFVNQYDWVTQAFLGRISYDENPLKIYGLGNGVIMTLEPISKEEAEKTPLIKLMGEHFLAPDKLRTPLDATFPEIKPGYSDAGTSPTDGCNILFGKPKTPPSKRLE